MSEPISGERPDTRVVGPVPRTERRTPLDRLTRKELRPLTPDTGMTK